MERPTEFFEWRRKEAARLLRRGMKQADVARRFGVSPTAVSKWWRAYQGNGMDGLDAQPHTGRPPEVDPRVLERLPSILKKGAPAYGYSTDVWTTKRIAEIIESKFGVRYHRGHVWRLMRALGWTWQKPQKRARERNHREINRWMREDWPKIQKKGDAGAGY